MIEEFEGLDVDDVRVPFWMRWAVAIARTVPGQPVRWPKDSKFEGRSLVELPADYTEQRIRGIKAVESRPINHRVRQQNGTGVVRGLEIRVTFDENNFEGSGIFLLGAILDRFFAEYAGINSVVQTVVVSAERGPIMRWPVRMGKKVEL